MNRSNRKDDGSNEDVCKISETPSSGSLNEMPSVYIQTSASMRGQRNSNNTSPQSGNEFSLSSNEEPNISLIHQNSNEGVSHDASDVTEAGEVITDSCTDPLTSAGHKTIPGKSTWSSGSKKAPGGSTGVVSSLHMDIEQAKVSLILKDDDDDDDNMDDVLISCTTPSVDSPRCPDLPSAPATTGMSSPDVDTPALEASPTSDTSSITSTTTGYSFVATHDEVRPVSSGQLSDSSNSKHSSSPPALPRVASNSRINSDKKKKPYWYNVLSPTYKSRSEDFKRIFKDIPSDERLIVDYSCALQKDILIHGRLYITQNSICFYANIFRWETILTLRCKDITSMTKEKTARVIPNAIQICTKDDKYFFTSFGTRDKTYLMLFRVWQNALVDHPMTPQELWQWVHYSYGEELGLNSSDEDYVQPSTEDEHVFNTRIQQEERIAAVLEQAGVGMKEDNDLFSEPVTNGGMVSEDHPQDAEGIVNNTDSVNNITNTSAHLPTDVCDTSDDEDDAEEVPCTGHEHLDIDVVEAEYNFNVDKLFEMIFTDSDLYRHFTEVKKTTELVQSQWSEDVDSAGDRHRVISYTLSLNYSIGPKTSPATEKQVLRSCSKPGAFYLVDTECINSSIPYGDNFYVVNRYCLNRLGLNRCRLKVTSAIRYRKSVWGLVKNFIEKNVTNGIIDSFTCLADLLQEESALLGQDVSLGPSAGKKKVLRRRRNISDRAQTAKHNSDNMANTHSHSEHQYVQKTQNVSCNRRDDRHQAITSDVIVKVICAVLIILAVFNGLLFYKLWSLEHKITSFHIVRPDLWKALNNMPESPKEWKDLLEEQRMLHSSEIEHWKEVLSTSIKLMHNMQQTLQSLEHGIAAKYQYTVNTHDEH